MTYNHTESPLYHLLLGGRQYKLPKSQVVNAFDDHAKLSLIKSGYVKRYLINRDGTKGIQVIYGPHDIFPLTPVYKAVFNMDIYSGPQHYYYEAMTDLEFYSISLTELQEALEDDPLIFKDLFFAAGLRLNSYIHRLESMSLRAANRKVVHQLLYLADMFGKKDGNGVIIQLPLTHQNLADMLNLARETVTNCLKALEEKGFIQASKQMVIPDIDHLRNDVHFL